MTTRLDQFSLDWIERYQLRSLGTVDYQNLYWQLVSLRLEEGLPTAYLIGIPDQMLQHSPSILNSKNCPRCGIPFLRVHDTTYCLWCKSPTQIGGTPIEQRWIGEDTAGEPLTTPPLKEYHYQTVDSSQPKFKVAAIPRYQMKGNPSLLVNKCPDCGSSLMRFYETVLCLWCRCSHPLTDTEIQGCYRIVQSTIETRLERPGKGKANDSYN